MCGGSGGSKGGGSGGGSPEEQLMSNLQSGKLSLAESELAERAMYRASRDAFWAKDYQKAGELENKYKVMRDVNHAYKVEQESKKIVFTGRVRNGPSVRDDDNAGGRRDLTSSFAKRMAKLRREGA